MSTFMQIAEPLAKMGLPITPVRPGTKRAFLPDFPTTATADLDQISVWDIQFPDHNAACVARAEEGGVFFWEVDSPDVLERVKKETGHDVLTEVQTFRVRSRPGRGHFYFHHSAESLAKLSNISQSYVKGGDWSLRTNREYVVAPGSLHPDTAEPYQALNWDTPIAEAPSWLIDWLLSQKVTETKAVPDGKRWDDDLRNENGFIPHGKIHGWMLTVAGRMRAAELEQDEIEPALLRAVHENCEGPIDDSKVRAMAKSICTYPRGAKPDGKLEMGQPEAEEAARPLVVVNGDDFLAEKIPPRKVLVHTIRGSEPVILRAVDQPSLRLARSREDLSGSWFRSLHSDRWSLSEFPF